MVARADDPTSGPGEAARQRLYLHVGFPKTGTTFLQQVLKQHREVLADSGFCYPYVRTSGMFLAGLEMTGRATSWGFSDEHVAGTFDELVEVGRTHGGTVILSHESFGRATPEQVEEIRSRLTDFEVHVVITVRDVGRTLTAAWQEQVKNGVDRTFAEYAERLAGTIPAPEGPFEGFWPTQNIEWALERWSALCTPERMHVVICPQQGAPRDELWNRFGSALGIPRDLIDLDAVETANESLGAPQIALLRQVNAAVGDRMSVYWKLRITKRWLAQELLSRVRSRRAVAPTDVLAAFEPVSRRWVDVVASGRHQVHGAIDDLRVRQPDPGTPHPDQATADEVLEDVPDVIAELVVRMGEMNEARRVQRQKNAVRAERTKVLRSRNSDLQRQLAAVRRELADAEEELRLRRRFWPFRVGPQKSS